MKTKEEFKQHASALIENAKKKGEDINTFYLFKHLTGGHFLNINSYLSLLETKERTPEELKDFVNSIIDDYKSILNALHSID